MFIVEKDGGETILAVAEKLTTPWPDDGSVVHEIANWDWSRVNFGGVDRSQPGWLSGFRWDGTNIVKKT